MQVQTSTHNVIYTQSKVLQYICPISTDLCPTGSNLNSVMVQWTKIATIDDMKWSL